MSENDMAALKQLIEDLNCHPFRVQNWTEVRQFNLMFYQLETLQRRGKTLLVPGNGLGNICKFSNVQKTSR